MKRMVCGLFTASDYITLFVAVCQPHSAADIRHHDVGYHARRQGGQPPLRYCRVNTRKNPSGRIQVKWVRLLDLPRLFIMMKEAVAMSFF